MNEAVKRIGAVAIGRNEGERLRRCLAALIDAAPGAIVYVDSGSTDDSLGAARRLGAEVLALSRDRPFTAARARNAGFSRLLEILPDAEHVFFIDGDCEIAPQFLQQGAKFLESEPAYGLVVGVVRELRRDASIYNRLCELEWAGPVGDIGACGGIFMVRRRAFEAIGGFNEGLIAAEDDDFCLRLAGAGWKLRRIGAPMCAHDAAMTRFGQWWRRAERAGHAYAQVGEAHPGYFRAERRRAFAWAFVLPAAAVLAAPVTQGGSLLLAAVLYGASWFRTRRNLRAEGAAADDAALYAAFLVLAKFPNFAGLVRYRVKRLLGRRVGLVEYK